MKTKTHLTPIRIDDSNCSELDGIVDEMHCLDLFICLNRNSTFPTTMILVRFRITISLDGHTTF